MHLEFDIDILFDDVSSNNRILMIGKQFFSHSQKTILEMNLFLLFLSLCLFWNGIWFDMNYSHQKLLFSFTWICYMAGFIHGLFGCQSKLNKIRINVFNCDKNDYVKIKIHTC